MTDSQDESAVAVEMSLRHDDERTRPEGRVTQRHVRERLFATLRTSAAGDAEVAALLDAYEVGHLRRDEAMAHLDWARPEYVNVRRRLDTLVRRIPDELRAAVVDVLTRDGGAPLAAASRNADGGGNRTDELTDTSGDDEEAGSGDHYDLEELT